MAIFLTGLGIALFLLSIQWYVEKKADEEESQNKEIRRSQARTKKMMKRKR